MTAEQIQDRIRGSLIGGAAGDALGYPLEFVNGLRILSQYGEDGLAYYILSNNGKALISDDTQMTLFTACGILNSASTGLPTLDTITYAYVEWYYTQTDGKRHKGFKNCWVGDIPEMNARRAPGKTCMGALQSISHGREWVNDSKGCGGVMRIAPIPLYGAVDNHWSVEATDKLAADASEITHQHRMGYIPSAFIAHVIYRLVQTDNPTKQNLEDIIGEATEAISKMYGDCEPLLSLIRRAVALSNLPVSKEEAYEHYLGEGWVAEETAAIAIYCSLKHFDDFGKALSAAVSHGGDSDSTGAVTGNILGAAIGYDAIPAKFKANLELHDVILHVADDLYRGHTTPFNK